MELLPMKKVLLLSLLLSVSFVPTPSHAALFGTVDKVIAGGVSALAAYQLLGFADWAMNVDAMSTFGYDREIMGATLLSVPAAAASAALLNPTPASSATAAKLGAATAALVSTGIVIKKIRRSNDTGIAILAGILAAPAAIIGAVALYSAFDNNWQLKA